MTPFEKAYNDVSALVAKFEKGKSHYTSPSYQESEARQDFIDDFFISLGWDVRHKDQHNPYEQEVKIEKAQKQSDSISQKRADYAFFVGPKYKNEDVRFFAEAKKPSVGLRNADHYFQTIRYGWNASTPIAVLTDFEEFHIIDCRLKPNINFVFNGQHKEYSYTDYLDKAKFAEIYYLFSREAVGNNSLEKYADALPKPKGKVVQKTLFKGKYQAIDDSFLEYIDNIREELAKAFKKNDPALTSEELTEATQRTLDRLIFIRFLEDKLIEGDNIIEEIGEGANPWKAFVATCRKLDVKYNGVVFKKHFIDEQEFTGAENRAFADICNDISSLNTPYDFNYIPIHILGSIYERFLGKVVRATEKRVFIEEKPEVRKSGGVYYTPKYIVDYIVQNTVGKLIEGKAPKEIATMHFADIACGSGSFLIGVYDLLLDYHRKYYIKKYTGRKEELAKANEDYGNVELKDKQWVITLKLKQDILLNNIYGVDIDQQAVEVTQLSLFLKMLEDETIGSTARQGTLVGKVLPDLTKNIACGNSLISSDINSNGELFKIEEEKKINAFDYDVAFPKIMRSGGFDAIVGNPPFIQLSADPNLSPIVKKYLLGKYQSSMGRLNTFGFFIKRALGLISNNCHLGYIIPNTITTQDYYAELRKMILESAQIKSIVSFDKLPFKDAVVENVILLLKKESNSGRRAKNSISIIDVDNQEEFNTTKCIKQKVFELTPNYSFNISFHPVIDKLKSKVKANSKPLKEYADVNQAIALKGDRSLWVTNKKVDKNYKPLLIGGRNINRYSLEWTGEYLNYDLKGIHSCKREDIFLSSEKIFFRRVANKLIGTIDTDKYYGLHTLVVINLKETSPVNLKYILGLFNSRLFSFYYQSEFASTKTVFSEVGARQVQELPIRVSMKRKEVISSLVVQILHCNSQLQDSKTERDRNFLENKCASLERQIDNAVYELYELTPEEIAIVEGE